MLNNIVIDYVNMKKDAAEKYTVSQVKMSSLPWAEAEKPPHTACSPQTQCRGSPPETAPWGGCYVSETPHYSNSQQSSLSGPTSGGSHNLKAEGTNTNTMCIYLQAEFGVWV